MLTGKIYSCVTEYYDSVSKSTKLKRRPVLIISDERNNDYTMLPVSRVTNSKNIDADYDIQIVPTDYPLLNLKDISYVRTHKQFTAHKAKITRFIGDLRKEYPELFLTIIQKPEEWNRKIIDEVFD